MALKRKLTRDQEAAGSNQQCHELKCSQTAVVPEHQTCRRCRDECHRSGSKLPQLEGMGLFASFPNNSLPPLSLVVTQVSY